MPTFSVCVCQAHTQTHLHQASNLRLDINPRGAQDYCPIPSSDGQTDTDGPRTDEGCEHVSVNEDTCTCVQVQTHQTETDRTGQTNHPEEHFR